LYTDYSFVIYQKYLNIKETSKWVEDALKKLPEKTGAGSQTATIEQLHTYHQQVMK